jgi:ring-1,2-phenylacetyl-CoA epoxidase subunit PaaC
METREALYNYLLRLGDNALISGHRLAELCSKGPILEEDLAQTNIALDYTGRAAAFLKYAAEVEGKGRTEDDLAYKRSERQFYNNLIAELPNNDFAFTIIRQLLLSTFEFLLFSGLCKSQDETIAGISSKAVKESRYHMMHSSDWTIRLGDGTDLSHDKIQKALNEIWMFTGELFEMNEIDTILIKENIAVDLNSFKAQWMGYLKKIFDEATLFIPEQGYNQHGSRKGIHTEYLGHILTEMQYLQRAYPEAKW